MTLDPSLPYKTPAWFREAVIYQIYVRSFADSNDDGIGDLQGVVGKLDYIQSLGVTAIWLMPIYPSPSDHGYDVLDQESIHPDFGTLSDLQTLIREAHRRGIKVLLDFIPSHVSNQHPYFKDALGNLDSPYADWFLWKDEAHLSYAGYDDLESMPRLNFQNSEVVDYLIGIAQFWLALDANGQQDGGVDGFRVDNALFPPQSFWSDLRLALKDTWPETVLLGEVWVKTPVELSRYFDNQFDALFDFPFYHRLQGNQDRNDDGLLAGHGFPSLLTDSLEKAASLFPEAGMPVRFLSNHDTNRISNEVGSDQQRLSLAATLLSSLPGPIAIYYGEEIGMRGQKGGPPFWDNYRREPMEWYASENGPEQTRWFFPEDRWNEPNDGISVEEQDADPASLLNFYRHVLAIRRDSRALRTGSLTLLEIDSDQELVWGFDRHVQDGHILALFNFGSQPTQVRLESLPIETDLLDLVKGKRYPAPIPGMPYIMELAAGEAVLLTRAAGPTP